MTESSSSESPLKAAAGAASQQAIETFELIGNETRLAILLALWEAEPLEPAGDQSRDTLILSFSELRERVSVQDSGQFNYHLEKLVGPFVYDTGDGYALRGRGYDIIEAVIAGTGVGGPTLELTEIDEPCELCGAPTAVACDFRVVYQVCTQCSGFRERLGIKAKDDDFGGMLFLSYFDPAGLTERTPQEVYEASAVAMVFRLAKMQNGVCPSCSARVKSSLSRCSDHDPTMNDIPLDTVLSQETVGDEICPNCFRRSEVSPWYVCPVCKASLRPEANLPVGLHPAVIDFYDDHGITVGDWIDPESLIRVKSLMLQQESELVSTDPLRVEVTIRHDNDQLQMAYDEHVDITIG